MERCWVVFFLAGCVVGGFGAVPKVEVTRTATGNCSVIQAADGDSMTVHYEGTFVNGTVFDSSFARNESLTFDLGNIGFIKGWNMGLQGACVGDELQLKIPYSLGYGDKGIPPTIPPRTDLNFKIHVLAIEDVELSPTGNGIAVEVMMNGTGRTSDTSDDDDYDVPEVKPKPFDSSSLVYKLQFLAIPVAVVLFILVAYCIYTIEYPDRKIKFYRVSDHASDGGLNRVI